MARLLEFDADIDLSMKTQFSERKIAQDKKKSLKRSSQLRTDLELDPALLDLVRLHIAQIHHSRIGVKTHRLALKARGERDDRLEQLKVWRESSLFSAREKTALAWGEAVSLNPPRSILKQLLETTKHYFNKKEIISLTLAIMAVADWNYQ